MGARLLPLTLSAALLAGCFVDSTEPEEVVQLTLSLGAPGTSLAASPTFNPWDKEGVFQLEKWSKYVRVAFEHKDGYELEPIQPPKKADDPCALCYPASWPSPALGIGAGEGEYGEVEVDLKLPAGNNRRLRALAYLVETGRSRVLVYREDTVKTAAGKKVQTMDLTAGAQLDLRVSMTMHPAGKVAATLRCTAATGAKEYAPARIALRDARAQVQYPFVKLTQATGEISYTVEIPGVPTLRPHYAVVELRQIEDTSKTRTLVIKKPSFTLSIPNDTLAVNLDIPCKF